MWYLNLNPPINVFMHQGAMMWADFGMLLRRNVAPNALLRIFPPSTDRISIATILDYSLPRKEGLVYTKEGEAADRERDSIVCVVGWLGGWIPIKGWHGIIKEHMMMDGSKGIEIKRRLVIGAGSAAEQLLSRGTLLRTPEVEMLMYAWKHRQERFEIGGKNVKA